MTNSTKDTLKYVSIFLGTAIAIIVIFILAMPPLMWLAGMWGHYWLAVPA